MSPSTPTPGCSPIQRQKWVPTRSPTFLACPSYPGSSGSSTRPRRTDGPGLSQVGRLHADTSGHPERSLVWRELLSDYEVTDVASVVYRDRFGCWGFLDLWRTGVGRPFADKDVDYLSCVAPQVTEALRRAQAQTFAEAQPAQVPQGPVVLLLSAELQVKAQTAETDAYLSALIPPEGDRRPVPAGAYNVGAQLIAREAGVDAHPPRARVHISKVPGSASAPPA